MSIDENTRTDTKPDRNKPSFVRDKRGSARVQDQCRYNERKDETAMYVCGKALVIDDLAAELLMDSKPEIKSF